LTKHVILMGPQGSGKGTQSDRIRGQLKLAPIATGELFREAIRGGSSLGQKIKEIYDRGELVPDKLTVALVENRLDQLAWERAEGAPLEGAIYDGFPRTDEQAAALARALANRGEAVTAVIAIDVPRHVLIERLAGRRVCSGCSRVYNVVTDPPASPGVCDVCGGQLIQRADDTPDAVAKRLDLYDLETAPVVQHYADQGLLTGINGNRPVEEVSQDIISAIETAQSTAGSRR
jgi:adenylate kinase